MARSAPRTSNPTRSVSDRLSSSFPVALLRAAHLKVALATTAAVAAAAALADRPTREVGLVAATVLVGQVMLGWRNDLLDRERDQSHDRAKTLVDGTLSSGDLWFALAATTLLLIPLSIANGTIAGLSHLGIVAIGMLGLFRTSALSPLPWAASYALWPAFLSYGGWGGGWEGVPGSGPPTIAITVMAALLGIGVHFLLALPGLVDDNADGRRHLPLRFALRLGASKLLVLAVVYVSAVTVGLITVATQAGLTQ